MLVQNLCTGYAEYGVYFAAVVFCSVHVRQRQEN